ncbi:MAG TPA: protein kinase [Polyangiaceae bacterium]
MAGVTETTPPGSLLAGKYRVDRVLGEGGMGIVVAATHEVLGQRVALKFLRQHLSAEQTIVARFLREARMAARIQSEHVARILDVGTLESGSPFMVMEYLEGRDLSDVLAEGGPMPIATAIEYVLQACEAIAEAHKIGIVHRDLKPSNLFLTKRADGSPLVKLLDFGISKATENLTNPMEQAAVTSTQNILGSPLYMSPEQLRSAKNVDARADVWSLGVILYELIAGKPPFLGESVSHVLTIIVADPHEPLANVRPDVPADLSAVIDKTLSKTKEGRYQNVSELARALLPYAPRHARVSVERISRLLGDEAPPESLATTRSSTPSDAPSIEQVPASAVSRSSGAALPGLSTTSQSSTHEPVSSSRGSRPSASPVSASEPKKKPYWLAAPAVVVVGLGIWALAGSGHSEPKIAPAVAVSTAAPPVVPPSATITAEQPTAAPVPTLAPIDPAAATDAAAKPAASTQPHPTKPVTSASAGAKPATSTSKPSTKPPDGFDPLGGRN